MTDQKPGPDTAADKPDDVKSAEPAGKFEPLPKAKQLTFVQQAALWILILIVASLFGMSGSLAVIEGPTRMVNGVTEAQILSYQNVDRKLSRILHRQAEMGYEQYSEYIKIAGQAESEGLMPQGKALDRLVDDFLDDEVAPGQTMRAALNEYKGGEYEITRAELKRKVALSEAYVAYVRRHVLAPAVPLNVADGMTALREDKVQVDEAMLDATTLVKPVPDDDPEIQQAYEKLRAGGRFTKPENVTLTVAYADIAALKQAVKPTDAEIQAYFDAHKADPDFQKPKAAQPQAPTPSTAPPKVETEPKTLDEMKATIADRIQTERAQKQAKEAAAALDADAESLEGQKDNATFKDAAAKKGLTLKEGVVVEAPTQQMYGGPRPLVLPGIGAMKDQIGLFARDKEPGFISRAVPLDGPPASWAVVRLEARAEAGFRPLSEVKPEVQKHLQGQRAYKDFIAKAQAARDAAQKLGPGGLAAYLATPEGAAWNVKPTQATLMPAETLRAPAPEVGQPSPESRVAASLAMPDRPVALVEEAPGADNLPRAKLVQARAYEPAKASADVAQRGKDADEYRRQLQSYRWRLFSPELQRLKEQK